MENVYPHLYTCAYSEIQHETFVYYDSWYSPKGHWNNLARSYIPTLTIEPKYANTTKLHKLSDNYSILGACKNPLHTTFARLSQNTYDGYFGSMPKDEPEYYYAERKHALYLNLIDAKDVKYIPDIVIDKGLEFIDKELKEGRDVFIVCNKGKSRSPSIAYMYLLKEGILKGDTYAETLKDFKENFCGSYLPNNGMADYTLNFYNKLNKANKLNKKE